MKENINRFLKPLVTVLEGEKIKYAVIGGIAVLLYGEPRFTEDIDVNILLEKDQIKKFLRKLKDRGFTPVLRNAMEAAEKSGYLPINRRYGKILYKFDIIIAENPIEFSAISRAKTKKIGDISIKVISPEDLIIHKIISEREKDRNDIIGILLRQKGKIDLRYIRKWLAIADKVVKNRNLIREFNNAVKNS